MLNAYRKPHANCKSKACATIGKGDEVLHVADVVRRQRRADRRPHGASCSASELQAHPEALPVRAR
jgi:hypothetical protein